MNPNDVWAQPDDQMIIPKELAYTWVKYHYEITRRGKAAVVLLLGHY